MPVGNNTKPGRLPGRALHNAGILYQAALKTTLDSPLSNIECTDAYEKFAILQQPDTSAVGPGCWNWLFCHGAVARAGWESTPSRSKLSLPDFVATSFSVSSALSTV